MLSFFTRDVLDEILNLIESVSEGFSTSGHLKMSLHEPVGKAPYLKIVEIAYSMLQIVSSLS